MINDKLIVLLFFLLVGLNNVSGNDSTINSINSINKRVDRFEKDMYRYDINQTYFQTAISEQTTIFVTIVSIILAFVSWFGYFYNKSMMQKMVSEAKVNITKEHNKTFGDICNQFSQINKHLWISNIMYRVKSAKYYAEAGCLIESNDELINLFEEYFRDDKKRSRLKIDWLRKEMETERSEIFSDITNLISTSKRNIQSNAKRIINILVEFQSESKDDPIV